MLEKIKSAYKLWHEYHEKLPKTQKYSLGNKIDKLFIEIIEAASAAAFLSRGEKLPYIRIAIRKLDTLKILLMILWETRGLDDKKYIALSLPLNDTGKMLGGWNGQVAKYLEENRDKENSPTKAGEK